MKDQGVVQWSSWNVDAHEERKKKEVLRAVRGWVEDMRTKEELLQEVKRISEVSSHPGRTILGLFSPAEKLSIMFEPENEILAPLNFRDILKDLVLGVMKEYNKTF